MGAEKREQLRLVLLETACQVNRGNGVPEHPVALLDEFHGIVALFAELLPAGVLVDLRGRQEGFVRAAVVAAVARFVEIALALQLVPHFADQLPTRERGMATAMWSGSVVRMKRPNCRS